MTEGGPLPGPGHEVGVGTPWGSGLRGESGGVEGGASL